MLGVTIYCIYVFAKAVAYKNYLKIIETKVPFQGRKNRNS